MRRNHFLLLLAVALIAGCSEDPFTASSTEAAMDNVAVRGNSRSADLALDLRADHAAPSPGEPFLLSLAVSNNGPHLTTRVEVELPVPEGTEVLGFTSSRIEEQSGRCRTCGYDDSLGVWIVGHLPRDSVSVLEVVLAAREDRAGEPIVATSVITRSLLRDPNPDNNRSAVVIEPRRRGD